MPDHGTMIEPVVKSVRVALDRERAFRLFTGGMGTWWPLETHSIAAGTYEGRLTAEDLVFEEREGGRIYEKLSDGSEGTWGFVQVWDPPARVVFTWNPNLNDTPRTEVEVRFTEKPDGTEVVLEHRGWEALGEIGPSQREAYDSGWPGVLELFRVTGEEGQPADLT